MDLVHCGNVVICEPRLNSLVELVNFIPTQNLDPSGNLNNCSSGIGISKILETVNKSTAVTKNCHESTSAEDIENVLNSCSETLEIKTELAKEVFDPLNNDSPSNVKHEDLDEYVTNEEDGNSRTVDELALDHRGLDNEDPLQTEFFSFGNSYEVKNELGNEIHDPLNNDLTNITMDEDFHEYIENAEGAKYRTGPTTESILPLQDTNNILTLQTKPPVHGKFFKIETELENEVLVSSELGNKHKDYEEYMEGANSSIEQNCESTPVCKCSDNEHSCAVAIEESIAMDPLSMSQPKTLKGDPSHCREKRQVPAVATKFSAAAILGNTVSVVCLARLDMRKHVCRVCHKMFPGTVILNRHRRIHSGAGRLSTCPLQDPAVSAPCAPATAAVQALHSTAANSTDSLFGTGVRSHRCPLCNKTFSSSFNVKRHKTVHTERPFRCPICRKSFIHNGDLEIHVCTHTGEKRFSCKECGKALYSKHCPKRHSHKSTRKKSFCRECGKAFSSMYCLRLHSRKHTGEKPFSCDDCGKAYADKSSLKYHVLLHIRKKLFSCNECGKAFWSKHCLKSHTQAHTGEKPFSCNECGKAVSSMYRLKLHSRKHTGEKPFSCNTCGKAFACKSGLSYHVRLHTGEKPFSCNECGKAFVSKTSLINHMYIHTGEKLYKCEACDKSFVQRGNYNIHMSRYHV